MKYFIPSLLLSLVSFSVSAQNLPHLKKQGNTTQLIVHNEPYLMLGGELGNSSATSMEYMEPIWPKLKALNVNTLLAPVYWSLSEPEEGKFDFTLVDQLIERARKEDLKLVLLWFGSWKNSTSSHVPAWVKLNQNRFPKVKTERGQTQNILTPFSDNNLEADKKAFVALMKHLKNVDSEKNTVIMVQVENEIATLPPPVRDHHPLANKAFKQQVPEQLIEYLVRNRDRLVPEMRDRWEKFGAKTNGTWTEVFGEGTLTDEYFMAWYFSSFVNELAVAGKAEYPLPMYVNAALKFPNGGPLPHLMDVWKAAGPAIDFLSPDFYNPDFKYWNDLYTRQGDPLFIPEHQFDETTGAKAAYLFGHYEGLGFSPFSIESVENPESHPLSKMYHVIGQLSHLITTHHGGEALEGFMFDKSSPDTVVTLGDYQITVKHEYTLGWSPGAATEDWPMSGAILIKADNGFYLGGTGVVLTFNSVVNPELNVGILRADEGTFVNGEWIPGRRLNGDQIHQGRHIHIPYNNYDIQHFKLYTYH